MSKDRGFWTHGYGFDERVACKLGCDETNEYSLTRQ